MKLDTRTQMLIIGCASKLEQLTNGSQCDPVVLTEIEKLAKKIQSILLHGDDNQRSE